IKRSISATFEGPGAVAVRDALEEQNDPALYKGAARRVAMNRPIAAPLIPALLITDLPPLPKEVEYRFLNRTLVLTDAEATCVLDYIPTALPEPPPEARSPTPAAPPTKGAMVPLAMPRRPRSVRFAVMGDTGTGGESQRKVADTLWNYYSQGNRFEFI